MTSCPSPGRPPRARRGPRCGRAGRAARRTRPPPRRRRRARRSGVRAGDVDEAEREHPRARLEAEAHLAAHRGQLLGGRLHVGVAEHEVAHRAVADRRDEPQRRPRRVERVEVLGERRPRPLGRAVALERAQVRAARLAAVGRDRRGREPVRADHLGREALQQLRRQQRVVPGDERRVRVQVDEAGAEHRAAPSTTSASTAPRSPTAAIRPSATATSATRPGRRRGRPWRRGRRGQTTADMPPSTYRIWPLTKSDAADARKTTAPASSDGSPQRPAGTRSRSHSSNSAFDVSGSVSSVRK